MTTQSNGNNLMIQGRIVWGTGSTLFAGKAKTDFNTGVPVLDAQGQPKIEYGFGLAIVKNDPATGQPTAEFTKIWEALHNEAFTLYPARQLPPDFAMKFKDGDGVDHNGKSYSDREGYGNHIILTCTTQIPIKYFRFENGNNILVNDGVKVGDYVNVQLNVKAHPAVGRGKAGLYVNPSAVQLIQAGKEIINTPSGDQIFGTGNMPTYNGQVVADTVAPMGQMPGTMGQHIPTANPQVPAAAPQMAPQMPQNAPQMAPPQQAPAAPNYGVIPEQHQPQQVPAAPQMGAMPGQAPQMGNLPVGHVAPQNAPMVPGGMNPAAGIPAHNAMNTGVAPQAPQMPGMPQHDVAY